MVLIYITGREGNKYEDTRNDFNRKAEKMFQTLSEKLLRDVSRGKE